MVKMTGINIQLTKKQAWLGIGILSLFQAAMLYSGFDGQIAPVIVPIVTYLFGIVTKTAVDKIKKVD
jgi:hypothetical protein